MGKDELYMRGMNDNVLKTCLEGQLLFEPTFKYNQGTNTYDTVKHRPPAWTDRVLFSQREPIMFLKKYNRAEITVSDHKPIYAHFSVKVNKVDEEAKALIEESLIATFNSLKFEE